MEKRRESPRAAFAAVAGLVLAGVAVWAPHAQELPALIDIRLLTPVSSQSPDGTLARAVTITSPLASAPVVPAVCVLTGTIAHDREVAHRHGRAALRVSFSALRDGHGESRSLDARVTEVDNARERVTPDGVILGLEPLRAVPPRRETLLLLLAYAHPFLLATTEGVQLARRGVAHPGIAFRPGTDMTLALGDRPPWPSLACEQADPVVTAASPALLALVPKWPLRTKTAALNRDADWVNIAFVGSHQALTTAFENAGWTTADRTSLRSDFQTFLALAAHRGYRSGPVSRLLLNGASPALVFQKQNNTFAKRHHIRIWPAPSLNDQPMWLAASTHDIGIEFSRERGHFTHRIDGAIDEERAKVVGDLSAAGLVDKIVLVPRSSVPRDSRNAAGDAVTTDGQIAIVTLKTISQ